MDRRLTPATARVAHDSLRGVVDAPAFTPGSARHLARPLTDLLTRPAGARERQLLLGDRFVVVDRDAGHAFGFASKDGYCGWLPEAALADDSPPPTHWVAAPASHLYPEPRVQAPEIAALPMGARLCVVHLHTTWAETRTGFVPACHLRALGDWAADPAGVAESLLGTPYLWGGNSRAGIDCSGLVQLALHACGRPCPGDSDLQQVLGTALPPDAAHTRGDLMFWRGHVAMVTDARTLIHANGHSMSVAHEPIRATIARIAAQHGGMVTHRRRP